MSEPKPLASLSAGLLARKGAARPAMRRQPLAPHSDAAPAPEQDDLGWNDMGYDVDPARSNEPAEMIDLKPLLTGSVPAHNLAAETAVERSADDGEAGDEAVPAIVRQRAELEQRVAETVVPTRVKARARQSRAAVRARDKAAFTLRLDGDRHLRLRLASAITNRSSQLILTDLLDAYLAAMPEIDAMAQSVPPAAPVRAAG